MSDKDPIKPDKKNQKQDKKQSDELKWSEKKKSTRIRSEALKKIINFYKKKSE